MTGPARPWRLWLNRSVLEARLTLRSGPLLIMLLLTLVIVASVAFTIGSNRGTPAYPTTSLMLRSIQLGLHPSLLIVVVLVAGEVVHRERSLRLAELHDALPVSETVTVTSKLVAIAAVVVTFVAASVVTTIVVQLVRGYHDLEPGLYLTGATAATVPFLLWAVLALFLQVVVDRKLLGYLLALLVFAARAAMPSLGLEHSLYRWAAHTRMPHSDMSGFGPFVQPFAWFTLYWSLTAAVMVVLSVLLWVRGTDTGLAARVDAARVRCRRWLPRALAIGLAGAAACGAWIAYNTNVLNDSRTRNQDLERRASYERQYGAYRHAALPRVTHVTAQVDIYPTQRRVDLCGRYRLVNTSDRPVHELPVSLVPHIVQQYLPSASRTTVRRLHVDGSAPALADEELHFFVFSLDPPLAPGAVTDLAFELEVANPGFPAGRQDTRLLANGTFFANRNYFPFVGYATSHEVQDPGERRSLGLPPRPRMADIDDVEALSTSYLDADWIHLDTTVSTSADQIAVAPGELVAQWQSGSRSFFRYQSSVPTLDLYVYMSAAYQVRRARWQDVDIEVYHHPTHDRNIDLLVEAARRSLAYCSSSFGPYPLPHLRIVEVPNYIGLTAFALSGVVPMSEAWGFSLDVRPGDLDTVTHVTAHEIAHQWWNHQVIGGNVQGATMIAEALAQYSALMVTRQLQGEQMVRHYLRWELDRYLRGRSAEPIGERPLYLVENQERIHYFKGSLAMYALQDAAGERVVNRALRRFLEDHAFQAPPYPTSLDLLRYLRDEVGEEHEQLIHDLFETITLWDNRLLQASSVERDDGACLVTLRISSRKLRADEHGAESEIPVNDWVDVAIFGRGDPGNTSGQQLLSLDRVHLHQDESVIEVVVSGRPSRAGVDPFHKLIDRNPDDNLARIVAAQE